MLKNAYFFWGNERMSWMRYMTIKSFVKLNPDWKVKLYSTKEYRDNKPWGTYEKQDFFTYSGPDYSDRLSVDIIEWDMPKELQARKISPPQLCDFFKWWVLSKNSGIYFDMDILFFKPIEDFYNEIRNYKTAICHNGWISIGVLASSGDNKFFKDLYSHTLKTFNPSHYQSAGVMAIYSKFNCREEDAFKRLSESYEGVCNFPYRYFYPYSCNEVEKIYAPGGEVGEACGLHWFGGHPLSQKYNSLLTEDTYRDYDTLFTRLC